jgi:hypothetical protein
MSLRLEMLQVARLAPTVLGDAADLVREFLFKPIAEKGAGTDRDGRPDLYYTIFSLAGLDALQVDWPREAVADFLREYRDLDSLDFVHLGALARCWSAVGLKRMPNGRAWEVTDRLERYRSRDGGYDAEPDSANGNAYGCFVALGAYQDLGIKLPEPLRLVQCLKLLERDDGGWANARQVRAGSTNATAAAVTLLHQLGMPLSKAPADFLRTQLHPRGGFMAVPGAPIPDLLSTATALHALACLEAPLPEPARELCLDFVDTLWSAEGGFHGHWADDHLDAEYTFYGLLALGHLSLRS